MQLLVQFFGFTNTTAVFLINNTEMLAGENNENNIYVEENVQAKIL